MIRMAVHFVWSMLRHQWARLMGYSVFAPVASQAYRNRQCGRCAFNEDGQCTQCKCLILAKTMMALEECPIGLWHRVWIAKA